MIGYEHHLRFDRKICVSVGVIALLATLIISSAAAREPRGLAPDIPQSETSSPLDELAPISDGLKNATSPDDSNYRSRSAVDWFNGRPFSTGPKTLLTWNEANVSDHKPNPKLVTDRPHFSEASSLVGLGRVQI